jgi:hypothetical protein
MSKVILAALMAILPFAASAQAINVNPMLRSGCVELAQQRAAEWNDPARQAGHWGAKDATYFRERPTHWTVGGVNYVARTGKCLALLTHVSETHFNGDHKGELFTRKGKPTTIHNWDRWAFLIDAQTELELARTWETQHWNDDEEHPSFKGGDVLDPRFPGLDEAVKQDATDKEHAYGIMSFVGAQFDRANRYMAMKLTEE